MPEARAGVVGSVDLGLEGQPYGGGLMNTDSASTWSVIWFAVAVLFLVGIYFGFGGLRGSVSS